MTEVVATKAGESRRLVLGFDAGCMACSDLAKRIEEAVGDKLEVRSLHDPEMMSWRRQSLGENAPWLPTLVEVENGKVKAWTGARMGMALSRCLGLAETWRIMRVLGEVKETPNTGEANGGAGVVSRSKFLKGLAGGVVAFSALSFGPLSALGTAKEPIAKVRKIADASTIRRLKASRTVSKAVKNFGVANWQNARVADQISSSDNVYVIPLGTSAKVDSADGGAFLVTDGSGPADEDAVIVKIRTADNGTVDSYTWYLPEGSMIATTAVRGDSLVAQEPAAGTRTTQASFRQCFTACLGLYLGTRCLGICRFCTSPIGCAPCIACGGYQAIRCARRCR